MVAMGQSYLQYFWVFANWVLNFKYNTKTLYAPAKHNQTLPASQVMPFILHSF
jgi:hypothetical protein